MAIRTLRWVTPPYIGTTEYTLNSFNPTFEWFIEGDGIPEAPDTENCIGFKIKELDGTNVYTISYGVLPTSSGYNTYEVPLLDLTDELVEGHTYMITIWATGTSGYANSDNGERQADAVWIDYPVYDPGTQGVQIKNQWGDVQIDGAYLNYRVIEEGSVNEGTGQWSGGLINSGSSGSGPIKEYNFSSTIPLSEGHPIVAIKPEPLTPSPNYNGGGVVSFHSLVSDGTNVTGFKVRYGYYNTLKGLKFDWKLLMPGSSEPNPGDYGLTIKRDNGELCFNSNNQYLSVVSSEIVTDILLDVNNPGYGDGIGIYPAVWGYNNLDQDWASYYWDGDNPPPGNFRYGIHATSNSYKILGAILEWLPIRWVSQPGTHVDITDKWFFCQEADRYHVDRTLDAGEGNPAYHDDRWYHGSPAFFICPSETVTSVGWIWLIDKYEHYIFNTYYRSALLGSQLGRKEFITAELNGGSL